VSGSAGRILGREALRELCARWRAQGETIVFTNGCFDILHVGHARYLEQARALGDHLVVGVNSDRSTRALKGPERPIVPEAERAEMVASLRAVDAVSIFDEELPDELIRAVRPHIHTKGGDYREEDLPEAKVVREYGGEVRVLALVPDHSTTRLVEMMRRK
jgi:rfaE bifunctional protein nucleotidyltransferase chain/domain